MYEKKLLELKPEKFSKQTTNDNSYFYTLIFQKEVVYVEQFIETSEDSEHVVAIIFQVPAQKDKVIGLSGTFEEVYKQLLTRNNI